MDVRTASAITKDVWLTLFNEMPSPMGTAIVHVESEAASNLVASLRDLVQAGPSSQPLIKNIVLDAFEMRPHPSQDPAHAACGRINVMRVLAYCAEASRVGVPLHTASAT